MKKWIALVAVLAATPVMAQPDSGTAASVIPDPTSVHWKPAPPDFPKGVMLATMMGDPGKPGVFVIRAMMPAHSVIPPHIHDSDEALTVISGHVRHYIGPAMDAAHGQALKPGAFVHLPQGTPHAVATDGAPAVLEVAGMGPFGMHYVNPGDDPSQKAAQR